jgi:hypothetical protein
MTGILDQIKRTTVASLEGVTGDFSDAPVPVYRPRVEREMIRTVKGATDLRDTMPQVGNRGGDGMSDYANPKYDTRPFKDQMGSGQVRSEGQVRYMDNLIAWITEKDEAAGAAARTWTDNVTDAGKWSYDKSCKFSISGWIDRLKAKNAELNEAAKAAPVIEVASVGGVAPLPVKVDKSGKPMHLRYAVDIDGTTKFYKIKAGRKPGFYLVNVQAADEFHPIRNSATKAAIIAAIVAAGPEACMARYGQEIGSCGRCGITLTDAESRARGIGLDCWGKM